MHLCKIQIGLYLRTVFSFGITNGRGVFSLKCYMQYEGTVRIGSVKERTVTKHRNSDKHESAQCKCTPLMQSWPTQNKRVIDSTSNQTGNRFHIVAPQSPPVFPFPISCMKRLQKGADSRVIMIVIRQFAALYGSSECLPQDCKSKPTVTFVINDSAFFSLHQVSFAYYRSSHPLNLFNSLSLYRLSMVGWFSIHRSNTCFVIVSPHLIYNSAFYPLTMVIYRFTVWVLYRPQLPVSRLTPCRRLVVWCLPDCHSVH